MSQVRFNVVGQIFSKGLVDRAIRKDALKNDDVDFVFMMPMAVAVRKRNDGNWARLGVDREIYFLITGNTAKIVNKEGVTISSEGGVAEVTGRFVLHKRLAAFAPHRGFALFDHDRQRVRRDLLRSIRLFLTQYVEYSPSKSPRSNKST